MEYSPGKMLFILEQERGMDLAHLQYLGLGDQEIGIVQGCLCDQQPSRLSHSETVVMLYENS